MREDRSELFYAWGNKREAVSAVISKARDRDNYGVDREWDVRRHLRRGKNVIVLEVENSTLSGCLEKFEIKINGSHLVGSPFDVPEGLDVENAVFHEALRTRFDRLNIKAIENALCARRMIEIEFR